VTLLHGDCVELMRGMPDNSVDAIVTDPPYELGFMGKQWDGAGIAYSVEMWGEALRVLKPGGHLLAFGGTRTYHRMACAIEDAGFEIRDSIHWVYGSGFPKSLNIGKQDGCEAWEGWGTALKPAHEPIVVARKPLSGTVAGNVLLWGTGGLNIDGCRVGTDGGGTHCDNRDDVGKCRGHGNGGRSTSGETVHAAEQGPSGRWPANVVFDRTAGEALDQQSGVSKDGVAVKRNGVTSNGVTGWGKAPVGTPDAGGYGGAGGASRFFTQADFGPDDWPFVYQAKPSRKERNAGLDGMPERETLIYSEKAQGPLPQQTPSKPSPRANHHPTVKPVALMRHLVRLVTPPGGTVLDPFAGSGTTLVAAILEGFEPLGCEMTDEYLPIIEGRMAWARDQVAAAQPTLL
jgi:DNA modification methylase